MLNNIHDKISEFWLAESSAINPKQCNFVLSQCKFLLGGKYNLHGKNKYGGQGSANSGNILILLWYCQLTKLEEY